MNNEVFEKYSIPKAVATLALPTMLSMLVTVFYNMADTLFVGQTGDANQVAAVSLATPVFLLFMSVANIFGVGGSAYISRLLGEQNMKKVKQVSSFCFYGCIAAGIIMSALVLIGMTPILGWIGCSSATEGFTRTYLTYIALGGIFIMISNSLSNIVRGEGAARPAMMGMMIGTIINIVLDPIMILWLNMGVGGAAIATILGNIVASLYYIMYFFNKKNNSILSISYKDFSAKGHIVRNVFSIGIPASLTNVLMSVASIILNVFLASYGDNPVAAMGVASKANLLVVMLQLGLAIGIQPLLGYCYGAKQIDKLKKVIKFSSICTLVIGTVLTAAYFVFTENIVRIFINDEEVIQYGIIILRALMLCGPIIGIMFILTTAFQAMGKGIPSLLLSVSRQGFVFLPVLIVGNIIAGINGVIYAQSVADIASLIMSIVMFMVIVKKEEKIAHSGELERA